MLSLIVIESWKNILIVLGGAILLASNTTIVIYGNYNLFYYSFNFQLRFPPVIWMLFNKAAEVDTQ